MPTALIVDDSPIDRRLAGSLVEKDDAWQVSYAEDGPAALAALIATQPDVVVSDVTMPEMNGLELTAAIKRSFPHLPIVIMTSTGSEEIAVQALKIGAASYVPKRRLAADLLPTLRSVVSASRDNLDHATIVAHVVSQSYSFEMPPHLSLALGLARHLQHAIAERWSCEKRELTNVGTALEEALLNALYHGCLEVETALRDRDYAAYKAFVEERLRQEPYRSRRIFVDTSLTGEKAIVIIRDEGPGFDQALLPDPLDGTHFDDSWGRGLVLIQTFMDEMSHNSRGNAISLVKYRPGSEAVRS